jgi:cellulose synthase/poly-beta-1,6-N-acetylglucosamine synthase-like glycosyltransferase
VASAVIAPERTIRPPVIVFVVIFWLSFGALLWTHAVYPALAVLLARFVRRPVAVADVEPTVTIVIAAHNEEAVIARRIENLLALDYRADRLQIVVTSDASTDRTEEIALQFPGVRVVTNPRGGKVAAQDRAIRQTAGDIVAFSDANATWAPDALHLLVKPFADPRVAYVCGQLRIVDDDGRNKEGVYWRYEMGVRDAESRLSSVTGGNGSIYAVRRSDYIEVDPRFGHDLSLPYRMVQKGRRAVYAPGAHAFEKATPTNETEYRRKIRMFEHCWLIVLRGRMLRGQPVGYLVELISHRHLRYASGILHLALLGSSAVLVTQGWVFAAAFAAQLLVVLAAALGVGVARYYVLVTWATVVALWNYIRRGVPATWEAAAGTR